MVDKSKRKFVFGTLKGLVLLTVGCDFIDWAAKRAEKIEEEEALELMPLVMGWDEFVYGINPRGWLPYVKQDLENYSGLQEMIDRREIDEYSLTGVYDFKNKTKIPIDGKTYERPVWHPGLRKNNKETPLERETYEKFRFIPNSPEGEKSLILKV